MEVVEPQATGPVFHFSEAPTVTTGFIAFVFDIRRDRSRAGFDAQPLKGYLILVGVRYR
jgi:hypothetical protein